jgi:hypothetical protein
MQLVHDSCDIVFVANNVRSSAHFRRSQHGSYFLLASFEGMLGASINLSKDDNNRDSETATQIQVLLCHVGWRMSTVHQNESIVREAR